MKTLNTNTHHVVVSLALATALAGCASQGVPPPVIPLDEPVMAQPLPEPPQPVEVVAVPRVLPMPAQMKPLPEAQDKPPTPEPTDERLRVSRANAEARVAPTREGYVNAIQVWPYTDGALYQVYAAPGRVTVISLQAGEELVTVAAGDTVRWVVGDTSSGSGDALRVNVLVKPVRTGLKTNLVVTTSRRTYLVELTSTEKGLDGVGVLGVPEGPDAGAAAAGAGGSGGSAGRDAGLSLERLRFRYAIGGSTPGLEAAARL
jgi:P-type conjugative transfer protein TrbG